MDKVSPFALDWDALVALGTLLLGLATVALAWSTRELARASRDDERAQWRPVLVPGRDQAPVDYNDATGEMTFEVRNVGRGPAFATQAQLRSGGPVGASQPGGTVVLAPGESFVLHCGITNPSAFRPLGTVVEAEIMYHDITERWHRSLFTIAAAKPPDKDQARLGSPRLAVRKAFVDVTDRDVLPVLGSPTALARQAREQRKLRNRVRRKLSRKSRP